MRDIVHFVGAGPGAPDLITLRGAELLKLAVVLLYCFPGSPTVFYGDEAGMQGFEDPLNRGTYPWGREDQDLKAWYARLGGLRASHPALQEGDLQWLYAAERCLAFRRVAEAEALTVVLNAGDAEAVLAFPCSGSEQTDLLAGRIFPAAEGRVHLTLPPRSGLVLK